MSLPAWVMEIDKRCCDPVCETHLIEALSIACKALEDIANYDQSKWDFERHTAFEAMRRIESLGESK